MVIKLLAVPAVSIAVFTLPWQVALALSFLQIIISFCLHFSFREQLVYLKAVLYYAAILIFAKLVGAIFSKQIIRDFLQDFLPTLIMLLKLFCVMQTASIFFKTTTPLQIRQALKKAPFAQALTLFICFIPQVTKNWEQIKKAWFARGGKKSLRMLIVLLPVLFSVGMKQAWNNARAICARSAPQSKSHSKLHSN